MQAWVRAVVHPPYVDMCFLERYDGRCDWVSVTRCTDLVGV